MIDQFGRWYPDYPGQQMYQDPAYMRSIAQPVQHPVQPTQMSGANQQDLTPTIRTELKQVDSLAAIDRIPQAAGTTSAFITKDETAIVFRTMYANGEQSAKIYDVRPPEPPTPKFDPAEYVRKDEVEKLVASILAAKET
jgi:hypothetical protein